MTEFLRTLWSATTCEFCGTRHGLGICPNCGSRRTKGERLYLESPHIEKIRATKQLLLRYKAKEEHRIAHADKIPITDEETWRGYAAQLAKKGITQQLAKDDVWLNSEQKRILSYLIPIVNELLGQNSCGLSREVSKMTAWQRKGETLMLRHLDIMLVFLESALDVEETLADIVSLRNETTEEKTK